MIHVERLIWDDWNIAHIARHEVTPDEVEEVCHGRPMFNETYKDRLRVVGPSGTGIFLTVILAHEGENVYYVITARPASRRERRRYRELSGDKIP